MLDSVDRDTFLMRDTVLARVGFSLSQCSFTLVGLRPAGESKDPSAMQPLVELRFADVTLDVESRPRLGSFLFAARLGSLHFLDRTADNPLYPYVLAPHSVVSASSVGEPSGHHGGRGGGMGDEDKSKMRQIVSADIDGPKRKNKKRATEKRRNKTVKRLGLFVLLQRVELFGCVSTYFIFFVPRATPVFVHKIKIENN